MCWELRVQQRRVALNCNCMVYVWCICINKGRTIGIDTTEKVLMQIHLIKGVVTLSPLGVKLVALRHTVYII